MDEKVPRSIDGPAASPHEPPMDWFPPEPEVTDRDRAEGETQLRYEDVSQDGRLMVLALPHTIGDVVWRKILAQHPLAKLGRQGIFSILTRMVVESGAGPIGAGKPLRAEGRFQTVHTVDARGEVDRLLLN